MGKNKIKKLIGLIGGDKNPNKFINIRSCI